jgi:hypothetical protein
MPPLPLSGRGWRRLAALSGSVLALGGCTVINGEYGDVKCPAAGVVAGIGSVSRFDGVGTGFVHLADRASLHVEKSDCTIDASGVTITMTVSTLAEIGPVATSRNADFPYFVAITDTSDKIVAKRVFANPVTFKPEQTRAGTRDVFQDHVQLVNPQDAERYHIVLGFQMTPDELDYNRSQK